ncbi:bacteriocin immunity protein [Leuconostoc mesenteroides]|uniref:bacteriocin immunity protein n=1 Tax=Leuconostoc mesenteroides TaxID=1245 RepID=UPI001CC0C7CE|nr:bacteriocin immunity protein [Leuconostoc mesenteroides]MBZ1513783.1 bacteriocin immunity protein [Leuconostoc mesenteroides]
MLLACPQQCGFKIKLFKDIKYYKNIIENLTAELTNGTNKSSQMLDIIDVLNQVNKNIEKEKYPERLLNKLVNYIRAVALDGKISFDKSEEDKIVEIGVGGQRSGLNGQYMADFTDKSQFYGILEEIPRH